MYVYIERLLKWKTTDKNNKYSCIYHAQLTNINI